MGSVRSMTRRKCSTASIGVGVELQAIAISFRRGPIRSGGGDWKKALGVDTKTWALSGIRFTMRSSNDSPSSKVSDS